MRVDVIDTDEALLDIWPKANGWTIQNLVNADVGIEEPASMENVRGVLPTLQRMGYQVYAMHGNGVDPVIRIGFTGFKFGRGQERAQLKQHEAILKEATTYLTTYEQRKAKAEADIARLKEAAAKGNEGFVNLMDVKKQVEEWTEILDFLPGPATDPISGTYIDTGSFLVTCMPTFVGGPARNMPADKWMVTTPVRFLVTEAGNVSAIGSHDDYSASAHPHVRARGICHGNLLQALTGPIQENNILAAVDMLREWNAAASDHDMEAWAHRSMAWWQWFLSDGKAQAKQREKWLFDGRWDGRTCQFPTLPGQPKKFITMEEYYEAPWVDILHVMTRLNQNHHAYPEVSTIKQYAAMKNNPADAKCGWCQADAVGCPCHGQTCKGCNVAALVCTCQPKLDKPVVAQFTVKTVTYFHLAYSVTGRNYAANRTRLRCEGYYGCQNPVEWHRAATNSPRFLCHAHLNVTAKEAYDTALVKATAAFEADKKAEAEATK